MDKLYDLMTTGFKYQIVSCKSADELLLVTINHLNCVRSMVSPDVLGLLDSAAALATSTYTSITAGSFAALRQTLVKYSTTTPSLSPAHATVDSAREMHHLCICQQIFRE